MPVIYLSLAWLAGIVAGLFIDIPAWLLLTALPFFIAAIILRKQRRPLILAALCLLALAGGIIRYRATVPAMDSAQLRYYNGKDNTVVTGMVNSQPEIRGQSLSFRFSASRIKVGEASGDIRGDALVRMPFYKDVHYGDIVKLSGSLDTPQQFDDFDYRGYLANQRIYTVINYPGVQVLSTGAGFPPLAWIYTVRENLAESLSCSLPEPQAALAQAILLGMRSGLPDQMLQSFYDTGTTHLIAISGMNLTIVLGMVLTASVWLLGRRNRLYIWISLSFIWLYTLLTGMPATMVRAAIMGSVFLLAEMAGRQRNGITALLLAAVLMLAIDPATLSDISFQLSFLSMLGLVLFSPALIRFTSPSDEKSNVLFSHRLKKAAVVGFGATLAAIIFTWPVSTMTFHSFSIVSLPATFFAMPAFPGIMITSMLTAATGLIWQPLGVIFGWFDWLFLSYFLLIVNLFSAIPVASITGFIFQPWQALAYYALLALLIFGIMRPDLPKAALMHLRKTAETIVSSIRRIHLQSYLFPILSALIVFNVTVWAAIAVLPDGKLHVSILDVGQGESILIRTPQGRNILIDAGPSPMSACSQLGKRLPFWDRDIDMLILTQHQSDHTAGAIELIRRYSVKCVALPTLMSESALSKELLKTAAENNAGIRYLHKGQQLFLGKNLGMAVLNPPEKPFSGTDDDINNNSIVLRLSYRNVSFLLTADISNDIERLLLMERADLPSTVLKVAHHGSGGSTSQEFLSSVSPVAAVISAGVNNRFGHPAAEVIERLKAQAGDLLFTTIINGTVEFITDGHRLWYHVEYRR